MSLPRRLALAISATVLVGLSAHAQSALAAKAETTEIAFTSHDGYPMRGKLTVPNTAGPYAVVIYVQAAEGMTIDMKRPLPKGTFNYFDLYREKLPEIGVGFFSYEGRGVTMGDTPPRYEKIDREVYNTSTLDNKVRDVLSAVSAVRKQKGVDARKIFLMGASEGTLLAAEAAARAPDQVTGGLVLYAVLSSTLKDMLKFQAADGPFMIMNSVFDADKDGKTSKAEYDADARKNRALGLQATAFETLDADHDGFFTQADFRTLRKPLADAIEADNFDGISAWLKQTAVVDLPTGWLQDHFAHPSMWSFLAQLKIPVGLFHGTADNLAPVDGTRNLEAQAKRAGKTNLEFHYFDGLDHSLGIGVWFTRGTLPEGHQAIFEFIKAKTR
jgi:pimeloyl-ACP methyl ester carboxylesterase